MEIVTALVISGLTALFIALPFFLGRRDDGSNDNKTSSHPALKRLEALQGRKESLYSAIRDIDLDYGLGKLTVEDYEELRQKYRFEAASVLKEIDAITQGSGELDAVIEDEIQKARGVSSRNSEEDEIEMEVLRARAPARAEFSARTKLICPKCGHESLQHDLFCSKCGVKLKG